MRTFHAKGCPSHAPWAGVCMVWSAAFSAASPGASSISWKKRLCGVQQRGVWRRQGAGGGRGRPSCPSLAAPLTASNIFPLQEMGRQTMRERVRQRAGDEAGISSRPAFGCINKRSDRLDRHPHLMGRPSGTSAVVRWRHLPARPHHHVEVSREHSRLLADHRQPLCTPREASSSAQSTGTCSLPPPTRARLAPPAGCAAYAVYFVALPAARRTTMVVILAEPASATDQRHVLHKLSVPHSNARSAQQQVRVTRQPMVFTDVFGGGGSARSLIYSRCIQRNKLV